MNAGDLLTPWMILAAVLVPLVYVEKWIHSHLYGVGWLLTNDNRSATTLYYVLLLPGVDSFMSSTALFMGTLSTATSVGITARILSEKRKLSSPEGVTIMA